ncbi:hypothetical protein [Pseudomonas syringae]|uniref:hypothetical protein n=1 Tax=Pseudomonas syringae TaxID=317 RepID=UPI00117B3731|nr:hypothetical protein [Pseudomonas syringae]
MIAPLVFRRFLPSTFLSGRLFLFLVGGIYITLTLVAIGTALSFQILYDRVPGDFLMQAQCLYSSVSGSRRYVLCLIKSTQAQTVETSSPGSHAFSLDPVIPVFRQGCFDHVGDKATSVHKVPGNEKNL